MMRPAVHRDTDHRSASSLNVRYRFIADASSSARWREEFVDGARSNQQPIKWPMPLK